jgi:hypothetical protein
VVLPACKGELIPLSALDSIVSSSDTHKRIVKAVDELEDSVPNVYKNTVKQRSTGSYFRKQ